MSRSPIYHELKHGSLSFPFDIFHLYSNRAEGDRLLLFHPHYHHHIEFILMKEGAAQFEIDHNRIIAHKGDILMINSGQIHSAVAIEGQECAMYAIVFDLAMMIGPYIDVCKELYFDPLLRNECQLPTLLHATSYWQLEVSNKLTQIIHLFTLKKVGFELKLKAMLFDIFYELFANEACLPRTEIQSGQQHDLIRMKTVLHYIGHNLSVKLSVKELAEQINMSPVHFYTFFKRHMGQTPVDFVNSLRMQEAAKLLLTYQLSIRQVALEIGMENVSYFNKMFKKYYKITPTEYMKHQNNYIITSK